MLKQARLYIKGDVTGVGFRAWTKIQTKSTKVTGWIQNVWHRKNTFGPHGGVEALIQGEERAVEDTIDVIREGPPISRVDDVDVMYEDPKEVFEDFEIRKSKAYSLTQ